MRNVTFSRIVRFYNRTRGGERFEHVDSKATRGMGDARHSVCFRDGERRSGLVASSPSGWLVVSLSSRLSSDDARKKAANGRVQKVGRSVRSDCCLLPAPRCLDASSAATFRLAIIPVFSRHDDVCEEE